MKNSGHDVTFKHSCYMWAISELKRYVPGNVWSFLGRTILFSEKGVSKKDIGKSLIIEAELFVLGAAIVSILSLPFLFQGFKLQVNTISGFLTIATLTIILAVYIRAKQFSIRNSQFTMLNYLFPSYNPSENLLLVLLSTVALFFFGLGNYFVIGSYIPLHPQMILELTGFFVLSFLAGYLSILTPAGFGVREGIIIYGLSKITTASIAAFASIFSRIILILSEVIFITLAFLWHKLYSIFPLLLGEGQGEVLRKKWPHVEKWISNHPHELIIGFLATLYTIYFTTTSFLRYDNFYTGRFDLGNMAQTVWNTYHGRIFMFTNPNGTDTISRLAFHADFILILLAPFYAIWSNPKMLLLIQTIVIATGAFFVYLVSKHILKSKNISLAFAFAYLINPSVQRANLYDFHAVTLATTLLLATYFFYLKKKYWRFLIFALLAAFCKEQIWLIVALFGVLLFIRQKQRLLGTLIIGTSLAMFFFLISYAIPHNLGSRHFALSYYSEFGDSPSKIIRSIILSPQKTYSIAFQHDRTEYLKQIFSPLGYLSLFYPLLLIFAIPDLIINLLSNNAQLHQIYYQYTATITPFLFLSAIWGVWVLLLLKNQKSRIKNYGFSKRLFSLIPNSLFIILIISYICINALNAAYKFGPFPGSQNPNIDMITRQLENKEYISKYLSHIPKRYSVAATNNVGSHLSQRQRIYAIPLGIDRADVIVMLLTDPSTFKSDTKLVHKLKADPQYKLTVEQDKFYVFLRKIDKN